MDDALNILVADDSLVNCMVLAQLLKAYGKCKLVHDGGSAVEAIDRAYDTDAPYDLICLDLRMPPPDGFEVLKHIRERDSNTRVLITTSDAETQAEAMTLGANGFMVKPYDREAVAKAFKELGLSE